MVLWASLPVGIVGLVLKHPLSHLFARPGFLAAFLIVNALIMAVEDRWHAQQAAVRTLDDLTVVQAVRIGLF
jgi:undecaprenyl-diphosphatase